MPELPEVETLRGQLQQTVIGRKIISARTVDARLTDIRICEGRKITGVNRHGKWLTFCLSGGVFLQVHLRMTGRLFYSEGGMPLHTRLIIDLGGIYLYLVDPRRFAHIFAYPARRCMDHPGKDALAGGSCDGLADAAARRTVSIKSFLLDQKTLAGIGNIYACELLFEAGVDPFRKASSLSMKEWNRLCGKLPDMLRTAVNCRGTSVSDWRDLFGMPGDYQKRLSVYKREGRPCLRCGTAIQRKKQEGRSTFYCPGCQR